MSRFQEGGWSGALKWMTISLIGWFVLSFIYTNIPHSWFFDYDGIVVSQSQENRVLKYKSIIRFRNAGYIRFEDRVDCIIDGEYERIGVAVTGAEYRSRVENIDINWTWREGKPFVIPVGTTECFLTVKAQYMLFRVIPLATYNDFVSHEVDEADPVFDVF